MLESPVATNYHQNLARFFANTDIVWLVGDARVIPSRGLRKSLMGEEVREKIMIYGDAMVIPSFGFRRATPPLRTLDRDIEPHEAEQLAATLIGNHFETLPIPVSRWPADRGSLLNLLSSSNDIVLHDEGWDVNDGPTDIDRWRQEFDSPLSSTHPASSSPSSTSFYKISEDYSPLYSPSIVISRRGQPFCTERFDSMKSVCVYQIYLAGAELWVMKDAWSFTIEQIGPRPRDASEGRALAHLRVRSLFRSSCS